MGLDVDVIRDWICSAEGCFQRGDIASMRACGAQILAEDENNAEGLALMAESSVYMQDFAAAKGYLTLLWALPSQKSVKNANLRGLLATAVFYGAQYELDKALTAYEQLFARYKDGVKYSLSGVSRMLAAYKSSAQADKVVAMRGYSFYADSCLLAGMPEKAAEAAFMLSTMLDDNVRAAEYFSKGLFISNYRQADAYALAVKHGEYGRMYPGQIAFPCDVSTRRKPHALRIGYISPDFRLHAAAYFFTALLRDGNHTDFSVYAYSTGREDHITQRFKRMADHWRNMYGRTPQEIAKKIHDDHIDILVDLSGHTQNSCLPVLACRPAPVQLSAIGYINTTGLPMVDYFLTDEVCLPKGEVRHGFNEAPLRLPSCHLCYRPEVMRELLSKGHDAPAMHNNYVTFGSFNSFAKVTDEMLVQWRNILQAVPESKLVIKCKTCSIPSGQEIVKTRFKRVGGSPDRLELRPFSPDYLMQYNDIDIILDTAPYNGGLTTCDALYMGVPVITLTGKTHGSRYGASIVSAVGFPELAAKSYGEYVSKAVQLAKNGLLLNKLHRELPELVKNSRLMDGKAYMQELEAAYRYIWELYCHNG